METHCRRGKILHRFYLIGIWFKGLNGIVEIAGGVLLLVVTKAALTQWFAKFAQQEISAGPIDWIATHLRLAAQHLSGDTKLFDSLYLICHGLLKVGLVWGGLWRRKLWAFPTALIVLGIFIVWQCYYLTRCFSYTLVCFSLIDLMVFLLISREYNVLIKERDNLKRREGAEPGPLPRPFGLPD